MGVGELSGVSPAAWACVCNLSNLVFGAAHILPHTQLKMCHALNLLVLRVPGLGEGTGTDAREAQEKAGLAKPQAGA